jgi:hypothetical protein
MIKTLKSQVLFKKKKNFLKNTNVKWNRTINTHFLEYEILFLYSEVKTLPFLQFQALSISHSIFSLGRNLSPIFRLYYQTILLAE